MELYPRFARWPFLRPVIWEQVFQKYEESIPDSLRRPILEKCAKIETRISFELLHDFEQELRNKYEDFGTTLLSRKDSPDWENVSENLGQMYDEYHRKSKVSIRVKSLDGNVYEFEDINRFSLVFNFKKKVSAKVGIPADEFMLVHNEKELEYYELLSCLGRNPQVTVTIIPRRRNGLLESIKFIFKEACDVTTNLVDWFPNLFRDTTRRLTEKDLSKVAQGIGRGWKLLGYELGMTGVQMEQISENEKQMVMRIVEMLSQWQKQNPFEATVGRLHEAMKNCSKVTIDWTLIGRVFAGM